MRRYERPGKHAVNVGDRVRVAGDHRERGWSGATLVALEPREDRASPTASVTQPGRAGLRYIDADRLTRTS